MSNLTRISTVVPVSWKQVKKIGHTKLFSYKQMKREYKEERKKILKENLKEHNNKTFFLGITKENREWTIIGYLFNTENTQCLNEIIMKDRYETLEVTLSKFNSLLIKEFT